jgi:RimJ/RimL family protein N-acetyltransferase
MEIEFRLLTADDLPLLHEWLGREHVLRWWGERGSYDDVVEFYLPSIEGSDPSDLYVVMVDGRSVGFIQTYLLAEYPEHAILLDAGPEVAGVDLFIADAELIGQGLGAEVIRSFAAAFVFARDETRSCVADPDVRNLASIRAFEKAGFVRVRDYHDPSDGELHALVRLER